jgi:hypothetical protein
LLLDLNILIAPPFVSETIAILANARSVSREVPSRKFPKCWPTFRSYSGQFSEPSSDRSVRELMESHRVMVLRRQSTSFDVERDRHAAQRTSATPDCHSGFEA